MAISAEDEAKLQQVIEEHPHLRKVYRDKVGKLKYLWSIITGGNFQVLEAYILTDGEKIELPGDWVVTIKKRLIIVTCDGFMFSRRAPIVVKPWRQISMNELQMLFGPVEVATYEDCDGLSWKFAGSSENKNAKVLIANDKAGNECLSFSMAN